MKKRLLLYIGLSINFLLVDCHSDVPPSCNVSKPLEELVWLQTIVRQAAWSTQSIRINQATYKERTVYKVETSMGADAGITTIYDCQGTILCQGNTTIAGFRSNCKNVFDEAKTGILLYQR